MIFEGIRKDIRGIKPDPIHIKFPDPEADHVTDVVADVGVSLVELHQQVVAAPVGV